MISAEPVAVASRTNLRVFEVDYRRDPRWERFISAHPDALIYHHPGWLSALEAEYGQKCVSFACSDERGRFSAILPLFPTKGLPLKLGSIASGRRLSSLPRTPMAGPLAVGPAAATAIVEHAVKVASSELGIQLEIKTQIPDLNASVKGLVCKTWRPTFVAELPSATEGKSWEDFWENLRLPRDCVSCEGCSQLRFGNAKRQHRVNWAVNKAKKLGLQVRDAETEGDLEKWYPLYLLTMRHNAVPPRPYRVFQSLWSSLKVGGHMRLLVAEKSVPGGENKMIAGSILLQFGQTVFYAFTGCAPDNWELHPHDILQIEAIRGSCRAGYRWYDFGEVAEEHQALAQFKTKWGGSPKPLYRYYFPALSDRPSDGPSSVATYGRRAWRHLPTPLTALLGDWIYSRM